MRARAISSASASSTYPIKQDHSQDLVSNRHSTPTPHVGMSTSMPTSQPTSYPTPTAYPTPTTAYPTSSPYQTPISAVSMQPPGSHPELQQVKLEPVVGMFRSPLQPLSTFSTSHTGLSYAHQVSEPELVGIKMTSPMNSLAGMI